jgi:hypothetical protein
VLRCLHNTYRPPLAISRGEEDQRRIVPRAKSGIREALSTDLTVSGLAIRSCIIAIELHSRKTRFRLLEHEEEKVKFAIFSFLAVPILSISCSCLSPPEYSSVDAEEYLLLFSS